MQCHDVELQLPRSKMYVIIELKVLLKLMKYPYELFAPIYSLLEKNPEQISELIEDLPKNYRSAHFEKFEKINRLANEIIAFFSKEQLQLQQQ